MVERLTIATRGQGLYEVTSEVAAVVLQAMSQPRDGLCTVFVRHTSASLVIQENADPSARIDLERWFAALVPDQDTQPLVGITLRHTDEGPDDMPAHVKSALTATSLGIPIEAGRLALGTWQGIYLWEHRRSPHTRQLVVHVA